MTAIAEATPAGDESRTRPHYHPIGIFFHWAMAALLVFQLGWGWWVSFLPAGYGKLEGYAVHALIGLVLLSLAFLRAGWRMIAPFILPQLEKPEDLPGWQRLAAEAVHFALYGVMFALPVTGWVMISQTAGDEVALPFGWSASAFPFPTGLDFVARARLEQSAETAHLLLVWITLILVVMHVGAALKHQFIDKDTVLSRMIPWLSERKPST